jgi:threonine dehydratase
MTLDYDAVADAARRLEGIAHRTPVVTSRTLDERTGGRFFLKCENLQRMGAFKFRGAYNAISRLPESQRRRGILAYSSGNHAQAIALVARLFGAAATVVMPKNAPPSKRAAAEGYGARIVEYDPDRENREDVARSFGGEDGPALVPPFDNADVIAGQGTAARELLDDVGRLDVLLVPCGGGGLLSGSAIAARHMDRGCRVYGVEPQAGDDGARSFKSGTLQTVHNPKTICDGARTESLGQLTFPIIRELVDDMLTVSDDEVLRAVRFLWERTKLVVEPTGALGIAVALAGKVEVAGRRVGVILSGGNADIPALGTLLARLPVEAGA